MWISAISSSLVEEAVSSQFSAFDEFKQAIIGLDVSHVWRGYGSALFFEFGPLTLSKKTRRDGSERNPRGELGLTIESSWRIENRTSVVCGSWSDESVWQAAFDALKGAKVSDIWLFGRLPEISIELTNDLVLSTFMTAEGDPEWALVDWRTPATSRWLSVRDGQLRLEVEPEKAAARRPD